MLEALYYLCARFRSIVDLTFYPLRHTFRFLAYRKHLNITPLHIMRKKGKKPESSPNISEDDRQLFRNSIGNVKKVHDDRVTLKPVRKQAPAVDHFQSYNLSPNGDPDGLSDDYAMPDTDADTELFFARTGLQRKLERRLKLGQLKINADLDLHGMTVEMARPILAGFIEECQDYRYRCILIIHGKGYSSSERQPVLKSMVNRWLRQHAAVLAFCSARPADGGTGAVYVLLKTLKSNV